MEWSRVLRAHQGRVAVIAAFVLLFLVAMLDLVTGWEVSVTIFYLPPIVLVGWFSGRRAGVLFALLSAATWLWVDALSGHPKALTLVRYWNAVVLTGYFLVTVIILSKLKVALDHERRLSRRDPTTGVANTRALLEWADREIERARRYHRPITFLYMDCDDFKLVNDRDGHAAGDDLLRSVAGTLQRVVRDLDLVARVGGDEFAVVLTETDPAGARVAVRRVQEGLAREMAQRTAPVTFSIGAATFTGVVSSVEDALRKADDLMYAAKNHGKNAAEFAAYGDPRPS